MKNIKIYSALLFLILTLNTKIFANSTDQIDYSLENNWGKYTIAATAILATATAYYYYNKPKPEYLQKLLDTIKANPKKSIAIATLLSSSLVYYILNIDPRSQSEMTKTNASRVIPDSDPGSSPNTSWIFEDALQEYLINPENNTTAELNSEIISYLNIIINISNDFKTSKNPEKQHVKNIYPKQLHDFIDNLYAEKFTQQTKNAGIILCIIKNIKNHEKSFYEQNNKIFTEFLNKQKQN